MCHKIIRSFAPGIHADQIENRMPLLNPIYILA